MSAEDIDDLFRARLAGHVTPPAEALWARLPAGEPAPAESIAATAQALDHFFQQGLSAHATPPGRELWERLEDEHLRPRRRRAAAWWPRALVAALALLLVAGSIGLWLGFALRNEPGGNVARQAPRAGYPTGLGKAAANPTFRNGPAGRTNKAQKTVASVAPAAGRSATPAQTKLMARATRSRAFASTAPKAYRAIPGPVPRRTTPPTPIWTTAADERQLAPEPGPTVAATPPLVLPPTASATAAGLASPGDLITVDVRNGAGAGARSVFPNDTRRTRPTAEAPAENRRLGGRLLQQAGHLMRGERLNLAEVTGLAETVTLRATVAGHRLTKTIQL